ncbi:MAG: hypothetical protein FWG50_04865 [Kiritimatiellaeota bacterium]|nr:hypothetical protein [Kiritimatiellota bacterium]
MKCANRIRLLVVHVHASAVCMITACAIAAVEPMHTAVPAETGFSSLASILSSVDALWEKRPSTCFRYIDYIAEAMNNLAAYGVAPEGAVVLLEEDIPSLFEHICRLPVQPNLENSGFRVYEKWRMLGALSRQIAALKNSKQTWLGMATEIGSIRAQIIPGYNYEPRRLNISDVRKTKTEMLAMQEENDRKNFEAQYQGRLRLICHNLESTIENIRRFAASLPPDERKLFLDKIKELARSDEGEAKLLDEPAEPFPPYRAGRISAEVARIIASRASPDARKQFLDKIKAESGYTEEELKILDAPFE